MRILGDRMSPSRWSMRTRVTAAATLVVALLLAASAAAFYMAVRAAVYDGLADQGTNATNHLTGLVRAEDPRGMLRVQDTKYIFLQVVNDEGTVLAASAQLEGYGALDVPEPPANGGRDRRTVDIPGKGEVYLVTQRVRTPAGGRIVHAGAPVPDFIGFRGPFISLLGGLVVISTAAAGYIVSRAVRRALSPVRKMSAELAEITDSALDRRVSVPRPNDEVSELAESVNVTLNRLEEVLTRQRGFVADVSHELRSPLTGLQTQLEVALQQPEEEDWPAVARAALADADRLQGIVSDLLILARLGAGEDVPHEPVDLGELVRGEALRRRRRVPVEVAADEEIPVLATPHHIVRVLTNLIDNAERHTESRIWVTATVRGAEAVVEVLDDGSGIAPEDRERIFWRFYRLSESRERDRAGTGLGLTISRDIARAHGGTLVAAESDRGTRFVLRLPLLLRP